MPIGKAPAKKVVRKDSHARKRVRKLTKKLGVGKLPVKSIKVLPNPTPPVKKAPTPRPDPQVRKAVGVTNPPSKRSPRVPQGPRLRFNPSGGGGGGISGGFSGLGIGANAASSKLKGITSQANANSSASLPKPKKPEIGKLSPTLKGAIQRRLGRL